MRSCYFTKENTDNKNQQYIMKYIQKNSTFKTTFKSTLNEAPERALQAISDDLWALCTIGREQRTGEDGAAFINYRRRGSEMFKGLKSNIRSATELHYQGRESKLSTGSEMKEKELTKE